MYNTDLPNRAELPSSRQLLRSTIIAVVVAAILLVTVVLPSEYGIDPTRVGRVLGLTQMGEIKMSLAREAEQDRAAASGAADTKHGESSRSENGRNERHAETGRRRRDKNGNV